MNEGRNGPECSGTIEECDPNHCISLFVSHSSLHPWQWKQDIFNVATGRVTTETNLVPGNYNTIVIPGTPILTPDVLCISIAFLLVGLQSQIAIFVNSVTRNICNNISKFDFRIRVMKGLIIRTKMVIYDWFSIYFISGPRLSPH